MRPTWSSRSYALARWRRLSATFFSKPEYVCTMNHCLDSVVCVMALDPAPERVVVEPAQAQVEEPEVEPEEEGGHDHHHGGGVDLLLRRPGDLLELAAPLAEEGPQLGP